MPLAGKQLMPRQIADYVLFHWKGHEAVKAVATSLGESLGYIGAYHDNLGSDGVTVVSRDCGIMEINIAAAEVGTDMEWTYRTESEDPTVYGQVVKTSFERAYALYEEPWTRDGRTDIRRWQPWFAYTEGWATWPAWWHWNVADQSWEPTGRYLQKAIAGVANYHIVIAKTWAPASALSWARAEADFWGVAGEAYLKGSLVPPLVAWKVPPHPTAPPEDNIGPKPTANTGV